MFINLACLLPSKTFSLIASAFSMAAKRVGNGEKMSRGPANLLDLIDFFLFFYY